jgi:glucose dehydrogenase
VFYGDDNGDFAAADSATGKRLWSFAANQNWRASPMTYTAAGRQFVAIAGGPNILAFAITPGSGSPRPRSGPRPSRTGSR